MNLIVDNDKIFDIKNSLLEVIPILLKGTAALKESTRNFKGGLCFREFFTLNILTAFRKYREPSKKWAFCTEKKINDDGIIFNFTTKNKENFINYCEKVEQIYTINYFKRLPYESFNNYLVRYLKNKIKKGDNYKENVSLVILNDVASEGYFDWQDFSEKLFPANKLSFLHVYFIGFQELNNNYFKYHLFSFTNQRHRQNLNGQFEFYLYHDGRYKFKIIQEINLLRNKKSD